MERVTLHIINGSQFHIGSPVFFLKNSPAPFITRACPLPREDPVRPAGSHSHQEPTFLSLLSAIDMIPRILRSIPERCMTTNAGQEEVS